jgi:Domain of unknown function (DUF4345)
MKLKNLHLIISSIIVFPGAIIYGFQSDLLFDAPIITMDQATIIKAIMGLYLGFGSLWLLGIFNSNYWKTATISNMIFMLGLGFGRIISLFFDGFPSTIFIIGTIGELVLGFYAFYILNKSHKISEALQD